MQSGTMLRLLFLTRYSVRAFDTSPALNALEHMVTRDVKAEKCYAFLTRLGLDICAVSC